MSREHKNRRSTVPAIEFKDLGHWLAVARTHRGLTQQQLSDRSGLDQTAISRIERGLRWPTLAQLVQVARVLEYPIQWFINGQEVPGAGLPELAVELHHLGVVDLLVADSVVPGAFRPVEQVLALAVSGDSPEPRIVEAIPAVLAWNWWYVPLLQAYSTVHDTRAAHRLGWLADVALTIHRNHGFPGGCREQRRLELFVEWAAPWAEADSLGYPADGRESIPPVSKRWKITYAAGLHRFKERAEQLRALVQPRLSVRAPGRWPENE
jgi:transcriptional regulator with XRE-family HTH domain